PDADRRGPCCPGIPACPGTSGCAPAPRRRTSGSIRLLPIRVRRCHDGVAARQSLPCRFSSLLYLRSPIVPIDETRFMMDDILIIRLEGVIENDDDPQARRIRA